MVFYLLLRLGVLWKPGLDQLLDGVEALRLGRDGHPLLPRLALERPGPHARPGHGHGPHERHDALVLVQLGPQLCNLILLLSERELQLDYLLVALGEDRAQVLGVV